MKRELPTEHLESSLSLYSDVACRDTGQYFCNSHPFSMPRTGNQVSVLPTGEVVFAEIYAAMMAAKHFIWIADWQMAFDVELVQRGHPDHPGRLHNVIRQIISTKAVQVRVLLFESVHDKIPGTFDGEVKSQLEALNTKGYPGLVRVFLQGPTSNQNDSWDYSHHQKFLVVDGTTAFIGGIDISHGRWETPEFDVVVDPDRFVINEMYNPCVTKLREVTTAEKKKIKDFNFAPPYNLTLGSIFDGTLIDEGCQPRMPWQDVHMKITGPSAIDIHRNFVRRWNMIINAMPQNFRRANSSDIINKAWLEKQGAWASIQSAQAVKTGGAQVQIVRSVSNKHLAAEGTSPDDLQLFSNPQEQTLWRESLKAWVGQHQGNILNAMVNCIHGADNYVYIETQFFISQFGEWTRKATEPKKKDHVIDSAKIGNENDGVKNMIIDALAARICTQIEAGLPFHVYLVLPVHPEGSVTNGSVWQQHWLALVTIKHGSNSLINRIKAALVKKRRNADDWEKYLTVLNMRSHGATVQYARDPKTMDEDFSREIGRFVVTEQIYIHSKLLIVDDAVAIVGSANINDRSLTGNGDTEIAAVVVDTEGVEERDLGSPNFKVQTRKFARDLRRSLWEKHFGFKVRAAGYFDSTKRAARKDVKVPAELPHPPRVAMTSNTVERVGRLAWSTILDKPCDPTVVAAIQQIAKHNASIYEQVFTHTPRNSMKTFEDIYNDYCLPYPMLFEKSEASGKDPDCFGVVPPALQSVYMTTQLMPHQKEAWRPTERLSRRHQVYAPADTVHDCEKAMDFLKKGLVGFFVAAPLDWGMSTPVPDEPTKFGAGRINISTAPTANNRGVVQG